MKNEDLDAQLKTKAELREERKRKEKEMKKSGKSVFDLQKIIKEKNEKQEQ